MADDEIVVFLGSADLNESLGRFEAPVSRAFVIERLGSPGKLLNAKGLHVGNTVDIKPGVCHFYPNDTVGFDNWKPLIGSANEAVKVLTKRSREFESDAPAGPEKRRKLFGEPVWHYFPGPSESGRSSKDLRFTYTETQVMTMGQSALLPLRDAVIELVQEEMEDDTSGLMHRPRVMLVHGPMGTGKSHLISLLLIDLRQYFQTKARSPGEKLVRFIPILDCSSMNTTDPLPVLQAAFLWDFSDNAAAIAKLAAMSSIEQIRVFARSCKDKLVFIFDQWQATEHDPALREMLKTIVLERYKIRVTSAERGELAAELGSLHREASLYQVKGGLRKDELAALRLIYGTPGVPESIQARVEEETGCNPGMLRAWHQSWCAITGKKPRRPLEQEFQKEVRNGAVLILGDAHKQRTLLTSNPGGLPAPKNMAPGKESDEARSGKESESGAAGLEEEAGVPLPEEKGALGEQVEQIEVELEPKLQTKGKRKCVKGWGLRGRREKGGGKTKAALRMQTRSSWAVELGEARALTSGSEVQGVQGVAEAEVLGWRCYERFMNAEEVLAIGESLRAMLCEAKEQGLESEKVVINFLKMVSTTSEPVKAKGVLKLVNLRFFDVDSDQGVECSMPLVRREVARFVDLYDKTGRA